jgi:hypothetical protein
MAKFWINFPTFQTHKMAGKSLGSFFKPKNWKKLIEN